MSDKLFKEEHVKMSAAAVTAGNSVKNSGQFQKGSMYAFRPGQCGNPTGRTKRTPISTAERDLEHPIPDSPELAKLCKKLTLRSSSTWAELIARTMIVRAIRETSAVAEIADRVEGRSPVRKSDAAAQAISFAPIRPTI
jgi:hypothetical protein